jgi:hypothetical protein
MSESKGSTSSSASVTEKSKCKCDCGGGKHPLHVTDEEEKSLRRSIVKETEKHNADVAEAKSRADRYAICRNRRPERVEVGKCYQQLVPGSLHVYPDGRAIIGKYPGVPPGYLWSCNYAGMSDKIPSEFVASVINRWLAANVDY